MQARVRLPSVLPPPVTTATSPPLPPQPRAQPAVCHVGSGRGCCGGEGRSTDTGCAHNNARPVAGTIANARTARRDLLFDRSTSHIGFPASAVAVRVAPVNGRGGNRSCGGEDNTEIAGKPLTIFNQAWIIPCLLNSGKRCSAQRCRDLKRKYLRRDGLLHI